MGPAGCVYYYQVAKDVVELADANSAPFGALASPTPRVHAEEEKFYLLLGLTSYF